MERFPLTATQVKPGGRIESGAAENPIGAPLFGSGTLGHGPGPCESPAGVTAARS